MSIAATLQRLTRSELHRLVWKYPLRELSQRFGVSDVAVGKACGRMRVPRPGTGYWLIRDAEKRSALKPRLQRLPADAPDRMRVWVINRPRLAQAKATPAKRAPLRVRVPKRLANPHPLVASARGILRAKGGVSWRKPHLDIAVDPAHLSRALRIMDALIKALERRGHSVTLIQRVDRFAPYQTPYRRATTQVRIGQEEVAFRLIERRRNNPSFASEPWSASRPRYLSTGRLRFEISHYVPDPKPRTS
jgi:hypothetical protein